ncbi:hypothetical protein ALC62_06977 [Cyphomyrmex costatus]|uniref:Uncharacterized protein n=1 Tax=Cyphomyrmex costatus TaxID=456900 RepID=A0A195CQ06_9HYME|nr:hypothetical protein ALC62_06977 [Cyphomyrmex costatus]
MIVLKQKAGLHYGLPPPSPPHPPSPWSSILRGDDRRPRRRGRRVACGVRVTQLRDKVIAKVRFHAGRAWNSRLSQIEAIKPLRTIPPRNSIKKVKFAEANNLCLYFSRAELFVLSSKIRQIAIINFRIERLVVTIPQLSDSGAGAPVDDEDTTRSCKRVSYEICNPEPYFGQAFRASANNAVLCNLRLDHAPKLAN